jgi:hypothetical protein
MQKRTEMTGKRVDDGYLNYLLAFRPRGKSHFRGVGGEGKFGLQTSTQTSVSPPTNSARTPLYGVLTIYRYLILTVHNYLKS